MTAARMIAALSMLFIPLLCSCTEQEPVKVGFIGSLSGKSSELCLNARDGIQFAVEEINEQGGLNGRQVELVVFDVNNNAKKAIEGVNKLTDAGVKGIIGPATSEMAKAATPAANDRKTVLISPTASTTDLSAQDDYFFRVYPTSASNARSLADYAARVAKNKRVAILSNSVNQAFVGPWQEAFAQRFMELGGEITTTISFNSENRESSLFEFAEEIIAGGPDGILILTNSIDAGLFSQQVKKLRDDVDLYGSDWTFSGELVQYGGKSVEGFIFTTNIDMNNEAAAFKKFKSNYVTRFDKEPNFPAVFSYEAAQLLFDALRSNPNKQQLPETLKKLALVKGLQASYKLDQFGDIERPPYLNLVENGKFVSIESP